MEYNNPLQIISFFCVFEQNVYLASLFKIKINFMRVGLFCLLSRDPLNFNVFCYTCILSLKFTLFFDVSTVICCWKVLLLSCHINILTSLKLWNHVSPSSELCHRSLSASLPLKVAKENLLAYLPATSA